MKIEHGQLSSLAAEERSYDLVICSASYEARSLSVPMHLSAKRVGAFVVAFNDDSHKATFKHLAELRKHIEATRGRPRVWLAATSRRDPVQTVDALYEAIGRAELTEQSKVLVDITAFTREGLLILVKLLQCAAPSVTSIEYIYAHAAEYSVGDAPDDKWLSHGIREIRSVLGYPGEPVPGEPTHLVMLVGFEVERAVALVREYEPSYVSVGVPSGDEEGVKNHQGILQARAIELLQTLGMAECFSFPCYDPVGARSAIIERAKRWPDCTTVVAPMNTKISTIGAALAVSLCPRIQICYAEPEIYNYAAYSRAGVDFYRFAIAEDELGQTVD